ncbi:MAG TPA: TetR family transcriptional regulator [Saprospiraceae bacterium]|nr:TetR family transcriptional regulator [Saprospiraceae bacterium]
MKELFLKLDDEKRKRIVEAGIEEFSRKLFADASINQIIKNAGIARGSFYLYFEDKLDFYCYLLDTIFENRTLAFVIELFQTKQLDFLGFFREVFKFNLELLNKDEHKQFFRNMYLGINKEVKIYFDSKRQKVRDGLIQGASHMIPEQLRGKPKRLNELINIIQLIQGDLYIQGIANNMSIEAVLAVYDLRISLLKTD